MTDEVVELTLQFEETPVGPADIRERCEALADRMAELEADRDGDAGSERAVATDGGVATADGGAEIEDAPTSSHHDERLERALSQPMAIDELAPGLFEVHPIGSDVYRTDPSLGACTCPDAEYNLSEHDVCKHVLAVVARRGPDVLDGGQR